MPTLKKLILAPFFLLFFTFLIFHLKPQLFSYDVIFAFSIDNFIKLFTFSALISITSFLFITLICLSSKKIVLSIIFLASILPLLIVDLNLAIILSIGTASTLLVTYFTLNSKLNSYINFEPASLFGPSIRHMATLLILVFSFTYFLSINKIIQTQGFQIPEEILDQALKFTPTQETNQPQLSISPEQLALLKQNPDLLKQSGLDPKILTPSDDLIKNTIKAQLETVIKPYLGIIPIVLAILFFFILQSITSLLNLLNYPLLWITFYILEKIKFIKFTEEQRTVRKMAI